MYQLRLTKKEDNTIPTFEELRIQMKPRTRCSYEYVLCEGIKIFDKLKKNLLLSSPLYANPHCSVTREDWNFTDFISFEAADIISKQEHTSLYVID